MSLYNFFYFLGGRFPDCDEPYPRLEDLLTGSEPTDQSSMTVQRDYGFWCPRELKVDPHLGYTFMGRKDCSAPCPSMFFNQQELTFIRYFIGVVSIVCLSATLFTFLTFLIDVTRFEKLNVTSLKVLVSLQWRKTQSHFLLSSSIGFGTLSDQSSSMLCVTSWCRWCFSWVSCWKAGSRATLSALPSSEHPP